MANELVAVAVDGCNTVAGPDGTNSVELHDLATIDCISGEVHVERKRPTVLLKHTEDVLLDGEAGVDIANREDRPVGVAVVAEVGVTSECEVCLLYTSPSPRDKRQYRMPSSA